MSPVTRQNFAPGPKSGPKARLSRREVFHGRISFASGVSLQLAFGAWSRWTESLGVATRRLLCSVVCCALPAMVVVVCWCCAASRGSARPRCSSSPSEPRRAFGCSARGGWSRSRRLRSRGCRSCSDLWSRGWMGCPSAGRHPPVELSRVGAGEYGSHRGGKRHRSRLPGARRGGAASSAGARRGCAGGASLLSGRAACAESRQHPERGRPARGLLPSGSRSWPWPPPNRPVRARSRRGVAGSRTRPGRAKPWAERALRELQATGATARPRSDPAAMDQLTAQELRVALVIAGGATTREAAGPALPEPKDDRSAPRPRLPQARRTQSGPTRHHTHSSSEHLTRRGVRACSGSLTARIAYGAHRGGLGVCSELIR